MKLERDLAQGERARQALEVLDGAFTSVREAIFARWADTPIRDKDGAHELRLMLKVLDDTRAVLTVAVSDGKLAAAELNRLNDKSLSPAEWRASLK